MSAAGRGAAVGLLLFSIVDARSADGGSPRPYSLYVWAQSFRPETCGSSPNGAYVSWRDERNWDRGCFARPYDTPGQRARLFDALGAGLGDGRAVKKIFLSVAGAPHTDEPGKIEKIMDRASETSPGAACPDELMTTVAEAHLRGVKVYALFGDDCHDLCEKDRVSDVVDYNAICSAVARDNIVQFDGVAINNEFLTKAGECGGRTDLSDDPENPDWHANEELWLGLLDGLQTAKDRVGRLPLHFSLGHSWALCDDESRHDDARPQERAVTWRGGNKKVVEHIMGIVDSIDIQVAWAYISGDREPEAQTVVARARFYHDYWFNALGHEYDDEDPNFSVVAYTNPTGDSDKFIFDEFDRPNRWETEVWLPLVRLEHMGAYALPGFQVDDADDGYEAQLAFPRNVGLGLQDGETSGPGRATQIQSKSYNKRGDYEARLKTARGQTEEEGIVSSFFAGKFYDCEDHDGTPIADCPPDNDGDGVPDNHEIDFEFQNSNRGVIYLSVWRGRGAYPLMRKRTARIDISQGTVIENLHPGTDELDVANAYNLGFADPHFDHSARFYTYSFEWRKDRVTFLVDLEDGMGRRQLFEVLGEENVPDIPLLTYANLWHTHAHWCCPHHSEATELSSRAQMHIDYIKVAPSSPEECQTSFAPHSSGAFERETSCIGSWGGEWNLDRTQQVMPICASSAPPHIHLSCHPPSSRLLIRKSLT